MVNQSFVGPKYTKPDGGLPAQKNLLEDNNLLCAGKFFNEGKWVKDKPWMANMPQDAFGCIQWNVLNLAHANQICDVLKPIMATIGVCTECHRINMLDMYKYEFFVAGKEMPRLEVCDANLPHFEQDWRAYAI